MAASGPGFTTLLMQGSGTLLEQTQGNARSLSLDLFDQWQTMEKGKGKWRFTSPTHVIRAFAKALEELEEEGGVDARHGRYLKNNEYLIKQI